MSLYSTLQGAGLPCAYSHFNKREGQPPQAPPYLVYMGNGQDVMEADDTLYWRENNYRVEYYFTEKDEAMEADIEDALLDAGFLFTKSEDAYIESEGVFVIYYYI